MEKKEEYKWQLCPKCNGTGRVIQPYPTTNNYLMDCPVCNGKMIISTITGQPPKSI